MGNGRLPEAPMVSKNLFQTARGKTAPPADARNHEGGAAYAYSPRHALAQYAATGCFNTTFYSNAEEDLDRVLSLSSGVDPLFVAKTAVYARERGYMKDTPALLCAALSVLAPDLCGRVFGRVIDDGKMLRNFVQIVRSGAVGRRSLGSMPKRLVKGWLDARSDRALFHASVGQTPSLADVIRMAHPKPASKSREALYAYLIGKPHDAAALPEVVQRFEAYKAGATKEVPDVPFQMLTALELGSEAWRGIATSAGWQMTRMNLNTFQRHGVFEKKTMVDRVAARLRDPDEIRKARAFPYQLLMAYHAAGPEVPGRIREALHDAMEIAIDNVPAIEGKVVVMPDVSGSMASPVTGHRKGSTTKVRCVDVAALVAAAVLRKNPEAEVIPFEHGVVKLHLSARDSVMTNAAKLAGVGGGGTSTSAPLRWLNARKARADLLIYVSDNESWVDGRRGQGTATMAEWEAFRARNPGAKLACIDIQPNGTTQAPDRGDILNVGGISDQVFEVLSTFAEGTFGAGHWVRAIEGVSL
jgi:60 kDa SS-A/Ro ribonucleoprotein